MSGESVPRCQGHICRYCKVLMMQILIPKLCFILNMSLIPWHKRLFFFLKNNEMSIMGSVLRTIKKKSKKLK